MSKQAQFYNNFTIRCVVEPAGYMNHPMITNSNSNAVFSTNVNTSSDHVNQWNNAHSTTHFTFGSILCVLFVVGLFEHILVLIVYCKNPQIRTAFNTYIIGLVLGDVGQLVFNIPFATFANLYGEWIFGDTVCQYYGFVVTSLGISQIALLSVISVKRYLIIVRHSRTYSKSLTKAALSILMCYVYGSLCAIGPVVGWSRYDVELFGTVCSIRWDDRTPLSLSYVWCLFIFGFFIPLVIITWSYFNIVLTIYRKRSNASKLYDRKTRKRQFKERRVAFTILIMIGMFIFSWSPYAVVSFYTSIHGTSGIPHGYFMVPPLIAKSSIIWNPVIYIWRNREFRNALVNTMQVDLCHCVAKYRTHLGVETAGYQAPDRRTEMELCDFDVKLQRESDSFGAESAPLRLSLDDTQVEHSMKLCDFDVKLQRESDSFAAEAAPLRVSLDDTETDHSMELYDFDVKLQRESNSGDAESLSLDDTQVDQSMETSAVLQIVGESAIVARHYITDSQLGQYPSGLGDHV